MQGRLLKPSMEYVTSVTFLPQPRVPRQGHEGLGIKDLDILS